MVFNEGLVMRVLVLFVYSSTFMTIVLHKVVTHFSQAIEGTAIVAESHCIRISVFQHIRTYKYNLAHIGTTGT